MTVTSDDEDREAELRSYLLGALPSARAEEIDEQVIADADLHAEVQATADDLIHAYLAGELSSADRERFESHFLASPRLRERVAFVRDLVSAVGQARTSDAGTARVAPPRRPRLDVMLPWAAALVVGLAAGGWGMGERRLREREMTAAQQRDEELRQELAARSERVKVLEAETSKPLTPADVSTWSLKANTERGPAAANTVTVSGKWVRLRVPLDHDLQVASYRASLQTPDGREVFGVRGLPETSGPGGRTVDVMVPASLLRPGDYLLALQRDAPGPPEELTALTFLVR